MSTCVPVGNRRMSLRLVMPAAVAVLLVGLLGGASAASASAKKLRPHTASAINIGPSAPTFVGPAATGCASGCSLLTGPFVTSSTASPSTGIAGATLAPAAGLFGMHAMPTPNPSSAVPERGPAREGGSGGPHADDPERQVRAARRRLRHASARSAGGATGVKGLNAVDSASLATNPLGDIEPPDQGLCAGNGSVVETNNIGEILVFNTALKRQSAPIPLDTVMGLTSRAWSSGGDPSCEYDSSNGGHWFFTEIVSASPRRAGGPFTGCFVAGPWLPTAATRASR